MADVTPTTALHNRLMSAINSAFNSPSLSPPAAPITLRSTAPPAYPAQPLQPRNTNTMPASCDPSGTAAASPNSSQLKKLPALRQPALSHKENLQPLPPTAASHTPHPAARPLRQRAAPMRVAAPQPPRVATTAPLLPPPLPLSPRRASSSTSTASSLASASSTTASLSPLTATSSRTLTLVDPPYGPPPARASSVTLVMSEPTARLSPRSPLHQQPLHPHTHQPSPPPPPPRLSPVVMPQSPARRPLPPVPALESHTANTDLRPSPSQSSHSPVRVPSIHGSSGSPVALRSMPASPLANSPRSAAASADNRPQFFFPPPTVSTSSPAVAAPVPLLSSPHYEAIAKSESASSTPFRSFHTHSQVQAADSSSDAPKVAHHPLQTVHERPALDSPMVQPTSVLLAKTIVPLPAVTEEARCATPEHEPPAPQNTPPLSVRLWRRSGSTQQSSQQPLQHTFSVTKPSAKEQPAATRGSHSSPTAGKQTAPAAHAQTDRGASASTPLSPVNKNPRRKNKQAKKGSVATGSNSPFASLRRYLLKSTLSPAAVAAERQTVAHVRAETAPADHADDPSLCESSINAADTADLSNDQHNLSAEPSRIPPMSNVSTPDSVHSAVTRNELETNYRSAQTLATDIKERLRSRVTTGSSAAGMLRQRLEEAWSRVKELQGTVDSKDKTIRGLKDEQRQLQQQVEAMETKLQRLHADHQLNRLADMSREQESRLERLELEAQVAYLESSFRSGHNTSMSHKLSTSEGSAVTMEQLHQQLEELRASSMEYREARDAEVVQLKLELQSKAEALKFAEERLQQHSEVSNSVMADLLYTKQQLNRLIENHAEELEHERSIHAAREDELIALAGELEAELMRVTMEQEAFQHSTQMRMAEQHRELSRQAAQIETLKKQLRAFTQEETAGNTIRSSSSHGQTGPSAPRVHFHSEPPSHSKTAGTSKTTKNKAHDESGAYGFAVADSGQLDEVDSDETAPMMVLDALWQPGLSQSTLSEPAGPVGARASQTRRMARRLNHPQRPGFLKRVRRAFGGKKQ